MSEQTTTAAPNRATVVPTFDQSSATPFGLRVTVPLGAGPMLESVEKAIVAQSQPGGPEFCVGNIRKFLTPRRP